MFPIVHVLLAAGTTPATMVVIGGGPSGFFGAIRAASLSPALRVRLLEARELVERVLQIA